MSCKRNKYTKEFKESAVKLVTDQGYSIIEAARNLGINRSVLHKWKSSMETVEPGSSNSISRNELEQELKRLKKENNRLRQEREILKKAFFVQEQGIGIK